MNKTQCAQDCEYVQYGKCNFTNNTCQNCTHGADDPKCLYTMDYCKAAQKEGRCKQQQLDGLFRMIEVNPGYNVSEFDVLFKDKKMYMQDFTTKAEANDLGDFDVTGSADAGGVTFEVKNWKPDPKIWDKEKMFGVFKQSFGESQTFTFLELAIGETAIKTLDDGLKGRYFVGVKCHDTKICDFSKASPKELLQTPARFNTF